MASPFHAFRKNMKPMMAFLFVLLMLTWVVGDSLFSIFAGRGAQTASDRLKPNFGGRELGWRQADQPAA